MHRVLRYSALGPVKSFTHHRLMLLEQKFNLNAMLNADKEFLAQKAAPHRDFYNVRKVCACVCVCVCVCVCMCVCVHVSMGAFSTFPPRDIASYFKLMAP